MHLKLELNWKVSVANESKLKLKLKNIDLINFLW